MLSEMIRAYVFHLIAEACVLLVLSFIEVKHLTNVIRPYLSERFSSYDIV